MDPWLSNSNTSGKNSSGGGDVDINLPSNQGGLGNSHSQFEDHFVLEPSSSTLPFEKLADHTSYLASLEKKLKAAQTGGPRKDSAGAIIRSLEETRESYMVKLLTDPSNGNAPQDNLDFDELKVNPILKRIAPEKQAVALEELVQLIKADQLSILSDEEIHTDPTTDIPLPQAEISKEDQPRQPGTIPDSES